MKHIKKFELVVESVGKITWDMPKYTCGNFVILISNPNSQVDKIYQITKQDLSQFRYQCFIENIKEDGDCFWVKNEEILRKLEPHEIAALRYNL